MVAVVVAHFPDLAATDLLSRGLAGWQNEMRTKRAPDSERSVHQVDLDELTYILYDGLRGWTASVRKRVFAPARTRRPLDLEMGANLALRPMRYWEFYIPEPPYACVSLNAVAATLAPAIDKLPGAIPSLWMSGVPAREREARAAAANFLAPALAPFVVLNEGKLDQHGLDVVWFRTPVAPDYAYLDRWP